MTNREAPFHTRGGARLTIRPIEAGDKGRLRNAFEHLGAESRYRRFLRPIKELTRSELAYLTEVDHRDHEALVATTPDGEIVGVARYIRERERDGFAEVAVAVVDDWQEQGVGSALLRALAGRAQANGIHAFTAICLVTNDRMLTLFRELGHVGTQRLAGSGAVEVEIELPTDLSPPKLAALLGSAATASIDPRSRRPAK